MRKLSSFLVFFMLVSNVVVAQSKGVKSDSKTAAPKPKTATTATKSAAETKTATPKTSSKTTTSKGTDKGAASKPSAKTADNSGKNPEDNVNKVDVFKFDKEQKNYNYNDRKKISSVLMPSYEYMQPFHENGKLRKKQQEAYLALQYYYPARPKNKWEIGFGVGMQFLAGDVDSRGLSEFLNNSGFHVEVRKALSYFLSTRLMYQYGTSTNRKWLPDVTAGLYAATNGTSSYNGGLSFLNAPNNGLFYPSIQTYNHSLSLDLILTLGNMRFHKERTKFTIDLFAGIAAFAYRTKADFRDANGNPYDFSPANQVIYSAPSPAPGQNALFDLRGAITNVLDSFMDGTYESYAAQENNLPEVMGYTLIPAPTGGIGLNYRINKLMNVGLLYRLTLPHNDLVDGINLNGGARTIDANTGASNNAISNSLTTNYDAINYIALNIAINVGGKRALEPMYWLNPVHHANFRMGNMDPKAALEKAMEDDDKDGVPNPLDKEANTINGFPVDVQGRALDSDKDGLKDGEDKEPFSPPGFPIDEYGVAIVPPPACCQNFGKDSLGNSLNGNGGGNINGGSLCSQITLPGLTYDNDNYSANKLEFVPILHIVGEKMQLCPDAKIVVSGINDKSTANGKYNEQLSYNRANEAINYLVDKYGISRDRFIMKYNQEGTGDKVKDRRVDFRYAKEGESGESNPPAPHPGLKAGKNN